MRRLNLSAWLGGLAVALSLTTACGSTTTAVVPTTPVVSVTETFSGTVGLNGAVNYNFATSSAGTVTATIATLTGGPGFIGFSLGTWNGVACFVGASAVSVDRAVQGTVLQGTTTGAGALCVHMFDPTDTAGDGHGLLTTPASFTVTVLHQ